jgi:hypothetical protein
MESLPPALGRLKRRAPAIAALAVAAIVAITFVARWRYLSSFDTAVGVDGYYYAVQLRSLLAGEGLYYPASPMAFWLMLPGAWVLGPIAGAKLGAALGTAATAIPVYAIVRRATGDRAAGVLGASLIATSAGSFYLSTEFVKQGIGLTLALAFVASIGAALDAQSERQRRTRYALAGALFVATLLSHLTAVGIATLFAVPPLWVYLRQGDGGNRLRAVTRIAAMMVVAALLVLLVVPAARKALAFGGIFGPASFDYMGERTFRYEVAFAAAAGALLAIAARGRAGAEARAARSGAPSAAARALLYGPATFAIVLALPWLSLDDPNGLVYRVRLMAFAALAICAPAALNLLMARARPAYRLAMAAVASLGVLALVPFTYTVPVVVPNRAMVPSLTAIAQHTPPDAVIIASDNALAFLVKWVTNREGRMKPIASDLRPTYRLLSPGIVPAVQFDRFRQQLPAHLSPPIRLSPSQPPMWLIAEPTWRALVDSLPPAQRARVDAMGRRRRAA